MLEAYFVCNINEHILSAANLIESAKCSQCILRVVCTHNEMGSTQNMLINITNEMYFKHLVLPVQVSFSQWKTL